MRRSLLFVGYLACIPVANLLVTHLAPVPIGFGYLAPAGVLVAGIAFTVRDLLQLVAGRAVVLLAIVLGTALSLLLAPPAIALASGAAFIASELLDMAVFTPLARRNLLAAVGASNTLGLVVDSVLFLALAFGSLAYLPGQIIGKLAMTLLALVILIPARRRLVVHAA